jgi:hypothetical protein
MSAHVPGYVVDPDGNLVPGRIWDPHIRGAIFSRIHELRHTTGFGLRRIITALEAEGWHLARSTVWRYLHLPCDVCDGDSLNPADFRTGGAK